MLTCTLACLDLVILNVMSSATSAFPPIGLYTAYVYVEQARLPDIIPHHQLGVYTMCFPAGLPTFQDRLHSSTLTTILLNFKLYDSADLATVLMLFHLPFTFPVCFRRVSGTSRPTPWRMRRYLWVSRGGCTPLCASIPSTSSANT